MIEEYNKNACIRRYRQSPVTIFKYRETNFGLMQKTRIFTFSRTAFAFPQLPSVFARVL
jgi:hypothetical protein